MTRVFGALVLLCVAVSGQGTRQRIGQELAIVHHLKDVDVSRVSIPALVDIGRTLFAANWTEEDGGGRPFSRGTGEPIADRAHPLRGSRAFNRVSGPDANSCQGCHNGPFGIAGGNGDFVTNGVESAERFDFVAFGSDEGGAGSLETVGNSRRTPGLFGAGFIEMLAREMTRELQQIRDTVQPGRSKPLVTHGISFGTLARRPNGEWDTQAVAGLSAQSLSTSGLAKPSLIVRPWRQSGSVVSLRDLTNTSFNQHHGIQSTERFGLGTDPDGDGVVDELTRADVTAAVLFQATLPVPGRRIPNDPQVERAIADGERVFDRIGCATCHVPSLQLTRKDWIYAEPGPYNSRGTLRRGHVRMLAVDLTGAALPYPRLQPSSEKDDVLDVPAYTDLKLHDISDPADASAAEPFDLNQPAGSRKASAGNRRFLTRRLWGVGNQSPYFHHGLFTTIRQAVRAHAGEALAQRTAFEHLVPYEQDALVEFLKSLQVLPPSSPSLVVDERGRPKVWPRPGPTQ
jgi:mono/diheme cytochrome c family protein